MTSGDHYGFEPPGVQDFGLIVVRARMRTRACMHACACACVRACTCADMQIVFALGLVLYDARLRLRQVAMTGRP